MKQQKTLSSNEKKMSWNENRSQIKKNNKKKFLKNITFMNSINYRKSIKFIITIFLILNCNSDFWFLIYVRFRSKDFYLSKQKNFFFICFMFLIAQLLISLFFYVDCWFCIIIAARLWIFFLLLAFFLAFYLFRFSAWTPTFTTPLHNMRI